MNKTILWIRSEARTGERRTILIPVHAQALIRAGYAVFVEKSAKRIYTDQEYVAAGCTLVEQGSWTQAPKNAIILGLKELGEAEFPLCHKHLSACHYLDGEQEAYHYMPRFKAGGGMIYGIEALRSITGRQIGPEYAGYLAGLSGAILGLTIWSQKRKGVKRPFRVPKYFASKELAISYAKSLSLDELRQQVSTLVIAPNGHVGKGCCSLLDNLEIPYTVWTRKETSSPVVLATIYDYSLLINCISLDNITDNEKLQTPILLTLEGLMQHQGGPLCVISDISCYATHPCNTMPIYHQTTTWEAPTLEVFGVDILAIDNLPTMLPKDSSDGISTEILPLLCELLLLGDQVEKTSWPYVVERFRKGRDRVCVTNGK
jgi:saccharopine dehydrogenase (NAD+, L-lysine forming)